MALTNNVLSTLSVSTQFSTTNGPATSTVSVDDSAKTTIRPGTGTGQLDQMYAARRTVSSSSPDAFDVNSVNDPGGAACAFARVNLIKITNLSATAGQNLTVGGGTHPLFSALPPIPPGGKVIIEDLGTGFPVAAGATDTLTVEAAAGSNVPYNITLGGRSV